MREKIVMVFLILCALVDEFIQFTWPADFTYTHISIVPHLYFCALLFLIYKKDSLDRTLIAAFFGILADFFMTSTFPMYAILYAVLGFCSGIFKDRIIKRFRWSCVMVWILLFFLDGIPFMIYSLFQKISVSFSTVFIYGTAYFNLSYRNLNRTRLYHTDFRAIYRYSTNKKECTKTETISCDSKVRRLTKV